MANKSLICLQCHCSPLHLLNLNWQMIWKARMVQKDSAWVQFQGMAFHLGWACCWFFSLLNGVFFVFLLPKKPTLKSQFNLKSVEKNHFLNEPLLSALFQFIFCSFQEMGEGGMIVWSAHILTFIATTSFLLLLGSLVLFCCFTYHWNTSAVDALLSRSHRSRCCSQTVTTWLPSPDGFHNTLEEK